MAGKSYPLNTADRRRAVRQLLAQRYTKAAGLANIKKHERNLIEALEELDADLAATIRNNGGDPGTIPEFDASDGSYWTGYVGRGEAGGPNTNTLYVNMDEPS